VLHTWAMPPERDLRRSPARSSARDSARFALLATLLTLVWGPTACAGRSQGPPSGLNSYGQAMRYVQKAVRSSSEGVIILPSRRAESLFDLQRLNDIAQTLRAPAAACFINRAIETMKKGERDGEMAYVDVPEGQIKLRTYLAPDGEVLRMTVLETGFKDAEIEPCIKEAIRKQSWIKNRTGLVQYLDVVYWVSLGDSAEDRSAEAQKELRRQQALAALRGKGCLEGRAEPGTYEIDGLNLLDREGNTLVSRIEPNGLPERVRECLAVVMKQIRMPRSPESFVRPVAPHVTYTMAKDGSVTFSDEEWISVVMLEEQAIREEKRAEVSDWTRGATPSPISDPEPEPEPEPEPVAPEPKREPAAPPKDPAQGGIKLKLGGNRQAGS